MKISFNNNTYEVVITRKNTNRNTYLRVKEDLKLYINTNTFTSDRKIESIIKENINSIENMYKKQLGRNKTKEKFFLLGHEYDIIHTNSKTVELGTNKIFIGTDVDIDKFLVKKAKEVFQERLEYYEERFSRSIPRTTLRIRKMKSRWGVCNTKTHVITLNLELIKLDISCLNYVINHELSHLIHANHSKMFWSVVEENYPKYKEVRKVMKKW